MSGLRTLQGTCRSLADDLLAATGAEACAIGYAHFDQITKSWVLAEASPVDQSAYVSRGPTSVCLHPAVLVDIANRARIERLSPVMIHTHPHAAGRPVFSSIDDAGEKEMKAFFDRRAPQASPLAMVIGPQGLSARRLGLRTPVDVWEVGTGLTLLSDAAAGFQEGDLRHDRQIRAFGRDGQQMIARLKILVVGAGGTGSATVQQLAYLGAENVTIVDPDSVEATNLNRLIGATAADIGTPKVDVARRAMLAVNPKAAVQGIVGDIVDGPVAGLIGGFDFIFLCTDSHASRAVVGQAAYQYLVPAIDVGVSVTVADGLVSHMTGRVQMLAPGLPCLTCTGALNGEQIRREMLTPAQRAADPYVLGAHVPQPAVVSINSTVASLAVTMFLGAVTAMPAQSRFQYYDGVRGTVRPTAAAQRCGCIVCSPSGALGHGPSWPLPVRPAGAHHV